LISNLLNPNPQSADHWVRHVEAPVLFANGLTEVTARGAGVLLEVGPHPVLLGLAKGHLGPRHASIATLDRTEGDVDTFRRAQARLFALGAVRAQRADLPAPRLIVVSGRTEAAASARAAQLHAHLEAHPEQELGDLAFSLAVGREHHVSRLARVA